MEERKNNHRSNFEAAQPPILIDNGVAVLENEVREELIITITITIVIITITITIVIIPTISR